MTCIAVLERTLPAHSVEKDTALTQLRHSRLDCSPSCAVEATISLIDGKWKCFILFARDLLF